MALGAATYHLPFEQDGWSMEVPEELRQKVIIEGLTVEERAESWMCRTDLPSFEGEQKGLVLHSTTPLGRAWGAYLELSQTATITFEALVTSDKPLADQTLTLKYFPDLGWRYSESKRIHQPILKPSPYYSSNLGLEKGHLA